VERQVKERLIGAAVLVAAAVILIPELLSGPQQSSNAPAPTRAGEASMKTYTIELNRSPDAPTAAVETPAPPPEPLLADSPSDTSSEPFAGSTSALVDGDASAVMASPSPSQEPAPPQTVVAPPRPAAEAAESTRSGATPAATLAEAKPESAAVESSTTARPSPPPATAEAKPSPPANAQLSKSAEPAEPLASSAKRPTSKQWAVQLGSFSSKANAERLVKQWSDRGQRGAVSPVQASGGTLYRARLGPFADREEADATLRKVRGSVTGAAIVTLP
jgi:DedD protein